MYDFEDEAPFTEHLLDQFSAYYTVTLLAMYLLAHWKSQHNNSQTQGVNQPKAA
jgi:hypothetical protein